MEAAQTARPRSKSHLSFSSQKSREQAVGHERKTSKTLHTDLTTKANPNAAMEEAQPIAAALEEPTLQSLRLFNHTDINGNPIAEPDLSNPTRSRWERPLDTIRSFEAAIDGEYRRRAVSMRQSQVDMSGFNSRRSSYYGGGYEQNRFSQASYYGNRHTGRDSYHDNYSMGGPVGPPPQRTRYGNRMQSDPSWNRYSNANVYPMNAYQQSRDTVNTNISNGSHSDGPYSTDPSSDNSSTERGVPVKPAPPPQPDLGEQYGFSGFGRNPILEGYAMGSGPSNNHNNGGPPPPPPHQSVGNSGPPPPPKHGAPIKLNSSVSMTPVGSGRNVLSKSGGGEEKRKSWFKKRFSKD